MHCVFEYDRVLMFTGEGKETQREKARGATGTPRALTGEFSANCCKLSTACSEPTLSSESEGYVSEH